MNGALIFLRNVVVFLRRKDNNKNEKRKGEGRKEGEGEGEWKPIEQHSWMNNV